MIDREKVINEYEEFVDKYECFSSSDDYVLEMHKAVLALLKEQETMMQCIRGKCRVCPHCANCDVDENGLLKEQEAVKPKLSMSGLWYECPVCNRHLTKNSDNYCARCGRPVLWKGR